MAAFRKSILVLMLLAIGIAAQGCATANKTADNQSSEFDRVHNDRMMKVVERADNATRRFNQ